MIDLGELFRDGLGVTQNCAKARELYQKAAAKDKSLRKFSESSVGDLSFLCKSRK
jgi:TPR repeat protein